MNNTWTDPNTRRCYPLDRVGNPIKEGSYIVYATRSSTSAELYIARVLSVKVIAAGNRFRHADWSIKAKKYDHFYGVATKRPVELTVVNRIAVVSDVSPELKKVLETS